MKESDSALVTWLAADAAEVVGAEQVEHLSDQLELAAAAEWIALLTRASSRL